MSTLMQASRQWSARPNDERFLSITDMLDYKRELRANSKQKVLSTRDIQAAPCESDPYAIAITGPNGSPVAPTHWAFGQLASRANAPAGYLRDLPAPLAADCINWGLRANPVEEIQVLLQRGDTGASLAAATGPNYGRIWDEQILSQIERRFGDGVTGDWRVPGEFGKPVPITKENTTLYAGDRDMFVFLADERNSFETHNRRDGAPGLMSRGVFFWNSEVGSSTFGMAAFLFDYVCSNRIVWGAKEYREVKIRHTAGAPHRWLEELAPAIRAYSNSSLLDTANLVRDAQEKRIGDKEEVFAFLAKRFTKSQAQAIQAAHVSDEGRPIETLWDASTGITAYARGVGYQNERVSLEREAGKVLDLAA